MIDERGGIQWPYPAEGHDDEPERRLFADGKFFTESGKAKMLIEEVSGPPEPPNEEYPFILLTGRGTVVQWHTQTRTGKVDMLNRLSPEKNYVQVNPADADRLGIGKDGQVRVSSRRGDVVCRAEITEEVAPGQLFMPMHYFETNEITFPNFDTYSHQPGYKYSAVSISSET